MKQALSNLIGINAKESIKKLMFSIRNRNFKPYVTDMNLYGTKFKFYVGNKDGESWYVGDDGEDGWLWPEMKFMKDHLCREGDVILECGGHHGLTACILSDWIGRSGKIYSFEPNPDNRTIHQKNQEINALTNVKLLPNAVGASQGKLLISNSSSNSYILKGKETQGIEVEVVTVDSFANLNPTILKIDVEGFEIEVLKGAQKLIKEKLPKLAIEVHTDMIERYGSSIEELLSLIDARYQLWIQWNIDEYPVPYNRRDPITHRVHIFGIPS